MTNIVIASLADVMNLVQSRVPESDDLDFKKEIGQTTKVARAIAAMANTRGGTIVFGIEEDASRAGQLASIDLRGAAERVANIARDAVDEPLILADAKAIYQQGDQGFLVVRVDASDRAPHLVNGQGYLRSGPTLRHMTVHELGSLFARRGDAFVQEYGLQAQAPADVVASLERERHTNYDGRGRPMTRTEHTLVLLNRGQRDALSVNFEVLDAARGLGNTHLYPEPSLPIRVLRAGTSVSYSVSWLGGAAEVRLTWEDDAGQSYEVYQAI
jgi:hypothetical protein